MRTQLRFGSRSSYFFVFVVAFLGGGMFATWSLQRAPTARADGPADDIAGVWVGTNVFTGEHFVQTIISDPEGIHTSFNGASVNVNYGPGVRTSEAGTQGESVRIAPNTYAFRAIEYGVVEDANGLDHIVTIIVYEGISVLDPQNGTFDSTATIRIFDASADGDNDGLPDPGAMSQDIPNVKFSLKRLGV